MLPPYREREFDLWIHIGKFGGSMTFDEMVQADAKLAADLAKDETSDAVEPTKSKYEILMWDVWESVPPAMRQYIQAYEALTYRSGVAILVDDGSTQSGDDFVLATGDKIDRCGRSIDEWVRHCQDTYAALVVLTGPGEFAAVCNPDDPPPSSSVLVFAEILGNYEDVPGEEQWALQVPVPVAPDIRLPHECIVLDASEVAESLDRLPQVSK